MFHCKTFDVNFLQATIVNIATFLGLFIKRLNCIKIFLKLCLLFPQPNGQLRSSLQSRGRTWTDAQYLVDNKWSWLDRISHPTPRWCSQRRHKVRKKGKNPFFFKTSILMLDLYNSSNLFFFLKRHFGKSAYFLSSTSTHKYISQYTELFL